MASKLAELLEEYYSSVTYPVADASETVPFLVETLDRSEQGTVKARPFWYDDLVRYLFFAHRVVFEDPIATSIRDISGWLHPSLSHVAFTPGEGYINEGHLVYLRFALKNIQRLELLIRRGICVPHKFQICRFPGHSQVWGEEEFGADNVSSAAELADILGELIGSGAVDSFRLPTYAVDVIKSVYSARKPGFHWWQDFFEEMTFEHFGQKVSPFGIARKLGIEIDHPLRRWGEHVYRMVVIAKYENHFKLGYGPHFSNREGYQLYEVLQVCGLLTEKPDLAKVLIGNSTRSRYATGIRSDRALVSYLDALMRPNLDVITNEDFVQIRLNDPLLEFWRTVMRDVIILLGNQEVEAGVQDFGPIEQEIRDHHKRFHAERRKRLKAGFMKDAFTQTEGTAIKIITNVLLAKSTSGLSLALPLIRRALEKGDYVISWKKEGKIIERHFLAIE